MNVLLLLTLALTLSSSQEPDVGPAAQPSPAVLAVVAIGDGALVLVDPETGEELARRAVGTGPHEVVAAADGTRALVGNYGFAQGGSTLSWIDLAPGGGVETIALEWAAGDGSAKAPCPRPHGLQILRDGRTALVTSEDRRALLFVDLEEKVVSGFVDTEAALSHMVLTDPEERLAFVANKTSGSLTVVDVAERRLVGQIPTGDGAQGMALHPTRDELWVTNINADTLSIVDPTDPKEIAEFACPDYPVRVAFTPDGARALVVHYAPGSVSVFDVATRERLAEIRLERATPEQVARNGRFGDSPLPVGILVDTEREVAYVAHTKGDRISVIDLERLEVVRHLRAGRAPDGMAWVQRPSAH